MKHLKLPSLTSYTFLLLLLITACRTSYSPSQLAKVVRETSLADYDGSTSFQVSLIDKIAVAFDTSYYVKDITRVNDARNISLITNNRERDYINFFYLNKDSLTLAKNLHYNLLATLSGSKIHPKIDSLRVYITETEVIIPYHQDGTLFGDENSGRMSSTNFIGPSRVRLQLYYQCYHQGLVTENAKLLRRTVASHHRDNTTGGDNGMVNTHISTIYEVVNELLTEAGLAIRRELESTL